ncbi:S9 family peptidase [Qipengyuania psychrotolerans]|uniref:S9 family peptidase n=1 Tax=Qipengyuania psychrotolerans TaxID=2867238 RepID=A0ABX8ZCU6_9SPHN|nr:S9 family peptidase [Qipengyuania psychrotolerans]QZD86798.1 S9 family peptidase [Qipengyuania psychrotolerans]
MAFKQLAACLSAATLVFGAPAGAQTSEGTSVTAPTSPPTAEKREHSYTHHGITISDPYHWLKDPSYPTIDDEDVLDYVKAENAWFEARMEPQKQLVEDIYEEMKARIKEDDSTVPQKDGDFLYWTEFEEGAEYRKWYRKPVSGGEAQLILDENALAEGHDYFRLGAFSVSQNGRYLAYSTDTNGSERYTIVIKDLESGEMLADEIPGTRSGPTWVMGDKGIVYGTSTEQWRTHDATLHVIGTPVSDDVELYRETEEEGFGVSTGLSAQEDWLVIATGDNETSEVRLVRADDPTGEQILVSPRLKGREYDVDVRTVDGRGTIYVHTNDDHVNFRLAKASLDKPGEWATVIEGSDEFYLSGFELFKDFFVTEGRLRGLDQIQLRSYADANLVKPIAFSEASFSTGLSDNPEYNTDKLRLAYESMVTPDSVYDYHVASGELELLKQQEIPSGYDGALYQVERIEVAARDGTMVPVSIVSRKGREQGGPLHLYAYGAYGFAYPPNFSTTRLSLVDRGFAFAIAHIRGGDDLGRNWYLQGKLNERANTFNDFVDVAKALIDKGYTQQGKITASGGSAGGELMGVILNTNPELWGAVVAHVPFVDVLSTMLDKDLPLTPGEWPEWGNPIESKQAFAYILSYSPYDQVIAQDYPPLLVTAGLNDPRVTYWEPAKWVAKLRELKTDDNELLLKTNMGAGHGGKSGRFASIYEVAEEYAFILWQLGMAE